jgi:hypothetical protein
VYTKRELALKHWRSLLNERSNFDAHVREVAENLLPRLSRFITTDRNRATGKGRNTQIIDSEGTRALRTLAAGLMSGMTSPARPWFRLETPDPDLNRMPEVKAWLDDVTSTMLRVFARSNTYNAFHMIYRELGAFGTAASFVEPSFENIVHHHPQTFGQYALELDHNGVVNTIGREFEITVSQAVAWFGYNKLSYQMKSAYDNSEYGTTMKILHIVKPRVSRDATKRDARNMPYESCYIDLGSTEVNEGVLRESGYRRFPALAPRWDVLWNDCYGVSPGMDALGDLLQLQQQQFAKAKAIDYQADPPVMVPVELKNGGANLLPGGVSYYSATSAQGGIRSAFDVRLDLNHLLLDIQDVRQRVRSAFYADMFLMLASMDNTQMTATEVAERHEEKLLMLGPVLERLHNEMLSPMIEHTFDRLIETGVLPPPPEELSAQELNVEFVSVLAQAQKAVSVNSVDRLIGHLGVLANVQPEVIDKYDFDRSVEKYADVLGVDPNLIVADDKVALIRQQRAQQQQAAALAEQANAAADRAAKLGTVTTQGGTSNAGADLMSLFAGYQTPAAS